ncbi:MAG: hypothetical protein ABWX61_08685 [Paenisporosarcina sp.]
MKKLLLGLTFLSVGFLVACGSEESTTSTKVEGQETKSNTEQTEEVKAEANIEVAQETYGAWTDSIDSVWVHYSAEIVNKGEESASIGDIQVNFEGTDGSVLGTDTMLSATPGIIQPGETAYITTSTTLDGYAETDFAKASLNVDFDSVSEKAQVLKADAVKIVDLSADEYAYSPYMVTGTIINDSGEKADDIRIASGLYDAEGKLLGVLDGSLDVSLNTDGKAGFELSYPELPKGIAGKATEVKVKVYNWSF